MTDYWGIVLNGLFTGFGVIIAHELYDAFKHYRKKLADATKEIITVDNTENKNK